MSESHTSARSASSSTIASPSPDADRDPYSRIILVLLAAALAGTAAATVGGVAFGNSVLLHTAVSLGLSSGILIGVALARGARTTPAEATTVVVGPAFVQDVATPPPQKALHLAAA